jgi:hypothetical protein
MEESEFAASGFGIVSSDWVSYMRRVLQYNSIVHSLMRFYVPQVGLAQSVVERTPLKRRSRVVGVGRAIAAGKTEIRNDFEFTHAMIIMAAWGAFEAFVTDICKALLLANPDLVETKPFENIKIPASLLFKDPEERAAAVYDHAVVRLSSAEKRPLIGVGKVEAQLKMVGLAGHNDISDDLGRNILHIQQTR